MEGFKLVISADASNAIQGLGKVESAAAKAGKSLTKVSTGANGAANTLTNFNRVVQDAPFGFIGIANNIDPVINSFQGLSRASGGVGGALKALGSTLIGPAGLLFAVSAITSLATVAIQKYGSLGNAFDALTGSVSRAELAQRELNKTMAESAASVQGEVAQLNSLITVARDETLSKDARVEAFKKLQKQYPAYFKNLSFEKIGMDEVTQSAEKLTQSLVRQAQIRGLQELISKNAAEQAKVQNQSLQENASWLDILKSGAAGYASAAFLAAKGAENKVSALKQLSAEAATAQKEIDKLNRAEAAAGTLFDETAEAAKARAKADAEAKKAARAAAADQRRIDAEINRQNKEFDKNKLLSSTVRRNPIAPADVAGAAGRPPAAAMAGINDETSRASVAAQELFANYQAIGTLISGTVSNAFGNLFSTLLNDGKLSIESLADSFKQLVVQLIQAVIQMAAMKAILAALNLGTGGAAGGIGGIANILGGLLRGGGFAQGGVSSGPQSGYLQLLHGTEYIIPANKFQNLIDNVQSMGGGGGVLTTRISGNDLQIIMNRAGNSGQFYR